MKCSCFKHIYHICWSSPSHIWQHVVSVQQHNSGECYQSQWSRAAETLSRETAGNRPHAASAWDQNSAPAGGSSNHNIRVLKLAWLKKSWLFPCVLHSGSPASTQRGGEDGLAGWLTVPPRPPLLEHHDGGHPRWREASQKSVTCQQQQRQVGNSKLAVRQTEINPTVSLTDCPYSGW